MPEALSRGRGRGSAAAGPAGVCGDESVQIQRHRLLDGNERKECNVTGNNHSILARELNATSTERMLRKSYRWSLGQFSFPSADPEGRFPSGNPHEQENTRDRRAQEILSGIVDRNAV